MQEPIESNVVDPPLDHAELCARARFRLDEPIELTPDELQSRERSAVNRVAKFESLGLRVTPTLTPGLYAKLDEVRRRLLMPQEPAVYVHADCSPNASAYYGGSRCVITVTSGLTRLLTLDEWGSVLGHEVAHVGMRHAYPDPETGAERIFSLERSRAAELSCDRLSMIAAGNARTAISALIKVTSGLGSDHVRLDVDAFLKQVAERPAEADLEWEALETHPALPFRVWAMQRFAQTDLCAAMMGASGGEPFAAVEDEICARFRAIGEGLVGRGVTDILHESLCWIAALLICEDGQHTERELAALSAVAGSVWAEDVLEYVRVHGLRATESRALESLRLLSSASKPVRARAREHINALVTKAGGPTSRERVDSLITSAWDGLRQR